MNSNGDAVWEYDGSNIYPYYLWGPHDADRLPNGNTLYVCGNNDSKDDAQVKEINASD